MDSYQDEQLAELKAWWNEYGRSIVVGIVLAVVSIGGWNFWTQYKNQQSEEASNIYYQMIDAYGELEQQLLASSRTQGAKSEDKMVKLAAFQQSVDKLKSQYSNTEYAHYARLQSAKYYVLENDLDAAESELRAVLQGGPNRNLELLTTLRLARVLAAKEQYDAALRLTELDSSGSYEAAFLEVRGDIFFQQGKNDLAFEAYKKARDLAETPSRDLDMKYFNLLSE